MIVDVENAGLCPFHGNRFVLGVNLTETGPLRTVSLRGAAARSIFIDTTRSFQASTSRPGAYHPGKSDAHFGTHPHGFLRSMIEPRQPLRVLCADDNVLVLDMLSKTLQSAGHHVEVATDGRAAVSRVEEDPDYFQLIVTDTRMPRLDGFGLVQEARSAGFAGQIIVFANALSAEDRQRYADLRVDRVIDKPGKTGELVGAISELRASLA
ncbi:MAG: hypothetical protein DME97_01800 [Verrucomicrobia bacterium]|nr:MAG: hypothetical protein DME97_01800 [Verrucomicrobiota bacterium]